MAEARVERRLAAILAADVAGYSRLMGVDEEGTLAALKRHRSELIDPKIAEHRGRMVKTTGDGALVEFASAVDATRCAVEMQRAMAERNAAIPDDRRIEFRIGINVGDIIIDDRDIFGDGVNIAARLEGLAEPGGICVSGRVHEDVQGKLDIGFEDAGEQQLKNILRPIRIFRVQRDKASTKGAAPSTSSHRPSIAVLPFHNMSSDPEHSYFAEGMTATLTTDLSRISGLFVIASTSTAKFGGRTVDVRQIGQELAVQYVLQGSIQRGGEKVRVTAQLVETKNGTQLWSDRFDGDLTDLFGLQDLITARIANTIGRQIAVDAARQAEKRTVNPQAEDLLVRGIAIADKPQNFDNLIEQEQLFRQTLALDPDNAEAWARLARSLLHQQINFAGSLSSQQAEEKLTEAHKAVDKALSLDANNARARFAEGLLYRLLRKPAESVRANEIAVALDRNFAVARNVLSSALLDMGQPEKSIPQTEQAMRLDPLGPQMNTMQFNMGKAHFLLQHTDEALDWFLKSRASNPNFPRTLAWIAALYAQKGDENFARLAAADLLRIAPHFKLGRSIDAPSPLSPEAHREYYDRYLLPLARRAGVPE